MKAFKFGDFDMQANGVSVVDTDVLSTAPVEIQADNLAERDGALIVKQQTGSKTFTVSGIIRSETEEAFEELLDDFKVAMSRKNQPFDVGYRGGVRRYLASRQGPIVLTQRGLAGAGYSIQFLSPDGMGWDVESTDLIPFVNITVPTITIPIDVEGSYKAEPTIEILINSVAGGTGSKTISLGNASTLRAVSITRDWAANDRIEIDALKGDLLVNGLPHPYRGQLPVFEPGIGGLVYTDDFTSRDVSLSSFYTRRWQ